MAALWQIYAELTVLDLEEALLAADDATQVLAHLAAAHQHLERAVQVLESKNPEPC
jgi:hypothetical protein